MQVSRRICSSPCGQWCQSEATQPLHDRSIPQQALQVMEGLFDCQARFWQGLFLKRKWIPLNATSEGKTLYARVDLFERIGADPHMLTRREGERSDAYRTRAREHLAAVLENAIARSLEAAHDEPGTRAFLNMWETD